MKRYHYRDIYCVEQILFFDDGEYKPEAIFKIFSFCL